MMILPAASGRRSGSIKKVSIENTGLIRGTYAVSVTTTGGVTVL